MTTTCPKGSVYQDLLRIDLLEFGRDQCLCVRRLLRSIADAIDVLSHSVPDPDKQHALSVLRASSSPGQEVPDSCVCGQIGLTKLLAKIEKLAHSVRDGEDEILPPTYPTFSHSEEVL